jgi:hypothetical protein
LEEEKREAVAISQKSIEYSYFLKTLTKKKGADLHHLAAKYCEIYLRSQRSKQELSDDDRK